MQNQIQQAADILTHARRLVILTGAGISKESGIPTFREAQQGLWAQYDPQRLATMQGFLVAPGLPVARASAFPTRLDWSSWQPDEPPRSS